MVANGNEIYIIGGCRNTVHMCFNDIYELNVKDVVWKQIRQDEKFSAR